MVLAAAARLSFRLLQWSESLMASYRQDVVYLLLSWVAIYFSSCRFSCFYCHCSESHWITETTCPRGWPDLVLAWAESSSFARQHSPWHFHRFHQDAWLGTTRWQLWRQRESASLWTLCCQIGRSLETCSSLSTQSWFHESSYPYCLSFRVTPLSPRSSCETDWFLNLRLPARLDCWRCHTLSICCSHHRLWTFPLASHRD